MEIGLKRAAKYRCTDLSGVRTVLHTMNACHSITKEQEDHIYSIYDPVTKTNSKRVKVRIENHTTCVYIYSRKEIEVDVLFEYVEIRDENILVILSSILGKPKIITKKREVWTKGDFVFHLDEVKGVGAIFEIELVRQLEGIDYEKAMEDCIRQCKHCLAAKIQGSNEDLVPDYEQT
jgi:adenylate cyclase class IV